MDTDSTHANIVIYPQSESFYGSTNSRFVELRYIVHVSYKNIVIFIFLDMQINFKVYRKVSSNSQYSDRANLK